MFQKPPHRPDFCPERKFGCWPQGNPAKLGAAGINPVKNPDISAFEGRLIAGRMIFTLNPAPGLFLAAFSFSSSRFVQGTTPPKNRRKKSITFPRNSGKPFAGHSDPAAGISREDNSLDYWCSQAARPLKPHLRGPESCPGASLGQAGWQHAPMLHFSCLNSRFFLKDFKGSR